MKRSFILLLSILFSFQVFGQKTEFSVELGSGFFSFTGKDAHSTSFYIDGADYTNNPYGTKSGFSYGINLQVQRVTKAHFIFGLQAGYESLSSRILINEVWTTKYLIASNSKTILTNQFINLHPFVGLRMKIIHGIKTDVTLGEDFGFCTGSEEHATVHIISQDYDTKHNRSKPRVDNRLRIDLTNYYKHVGLTIGYSYGMTNYLAGMVGTATSVPGAEVGSFAAYSQMIRLGLVYKL